MPVAPFIRKGISKGYWLPAVAGASPTRAEINAGVVLGTYLTAIAGFTYSGTRVAVPLLANRLNIQVDGEDTLADSSLTFVDDIVTPPPIRAAASKGTAGFIFLCPYGDVAAKRGEVYPSKSMGVNDNWDVGGNAVATFVIEVAITDVPNQAAVIPAA